MERLKVFMWATLDGFRSTARTLGISPKALAPFVGATITALLALFGLSPADIGSWVGVEGVVVAGAITTVAGAVAAYLLPAGIVMAADAQEAPNGR